MERNVDNAGWVTFGTTLALMTVSDLAAQFVTALLTMVAGVIAVHFVKRELHRRWPVRSAVGQPHKQREDDEE